MLENRKDIRLNIAKNIKRFREMNNLTQKQLAEKLNVKNSAVSNWESNANSPDKIIFSNVTFMSQHTPN